MSARQRAKQVLCILLVLVFVVQLVPTSVVAEIAESVQAPMKTSGTVIATDIAEAATVLGEIESERDEAVKHYRLNDGSYVAVQYAEPVHYRSADGQWRDIDNTLRLDGEEYVSENGAVTKRFPAELSSGRLFEIAYGEYSVSMSAYRADGSESGSGRIEEPILPELGSTASVVNPEPESVKGLEPEELPTPTGLLSSVRYEGAYAGADLVYENQGYDIKESIIVKQAQRSYTYAFTVQAKGLEARLTETGAVELRNAEGEAIFEIPAPYMVDAAGEVSSAAEYALVETEDGYVLGLRADAEWMNAPGRAYPVTIDPSVIVVAYSNSSITAAEVRQGSPNTSYPNYDTYNLGYGVMSSARESRIYLGFDSLPDIPNNCTMTNASIGIMQVDYSHVGAATAKFSAYQVSDVLPAGKTYKEWISSRTWNTRPGCADEVIDYVTVTSAKDDYYLVWDVTSAVLGWYASSGKTRAIAFTLNDAEQYNTSHAVVLTVGGNNGRYRPILQVSYRNTVGLEDYYTYRSAGIGRAGTAYIGDYSNQLTVVNSVAGYGSDAVGAELALVYNTAYAGYNFGEAAGGMNAPELGNMKFGLGWKLSLEQTVKEVTVGGERYLVYNDADGTEHYFQSVGGKYRDEDGLGLEITPSGGGYSMTDTDSYHTWTFSSAGVLTKITDSNGNATSINYSGGQISSVTVQTDGGESVTVARLSYNTWGYLIGLTNHRGEQTSFAYDSTGELLRISYPDGKTARYGYESGYMVSATDNESGYGLTMSYRGNGHGGRTINRVTETVGGAEGAGLHAYKNSQQLSSYRFYGPDHTAETEDDVVAYYAFDHSGRTICTYQTNHDKTKVIGSSAASYTQNSAASNKNNRLTGAGAMGLATPNVKLDGDFEHSWVVDASGAEARSKSYNATGTESNRVRNGKWSMRLSGSDSGYLKVELTGGEEYTASCYVNSSAAVGWTNGGSYGRISIKQPDGSFLRSEKTATQTSPEQENGWARISYTFSAPATGEYLVGVETGGFTGSYYVDDMQLDRGDTAGVRNLVLNPKPSKAGFWGLGSGASYDAESASPFGAGVLKLDGGPETLAMAAQDVPINGKGGTYLVSGWAKANAVGRTGTDYGSEPYFGMIAAVYYAGESGEEWHLIPFNKDYTQWQYASGIVIPRQSEKTVETIKLYLIYSQNGNTAYFDNLSIVAEPCSSYSYDDKGNPVSAKEGGAKTSCEYESGTSILKKYTASTGVVTSFSYESTTHNLTGVSGAGVRTTNVYNEAGLLTSSYTLSDDMHGAYESSATYNAYGEKTSETDGNYVTTQYERNASSHNLVGTQIGSNYRQKYNYDAAGRLMVSFHDGKVAQHYGYENGNLSTMSRKSRVGSGAFSWQSYHFTYDAFGNMTSIGVSGAENGQTPSSKSVLAQYAYEPGVNNGRLKTMSYANGDTVGYEYDIFDRVVAERYNSGSKSVSYEYKYDSNGALTEQGSSSGERYGYEYDSLGRLIRSSESKNGAYIQRTEHIYDASDRLTKQSWYNSGGATSLTYAYAANNGLLTSLTVGGILSLPVSYGYNNINQLDSKAVGGVYAKGYEYEKYRVDPNRLSSKNLVSKLSYSGNVTEVWQYGYDSNGRIISEINGSSRSIYSYDGQGQLVRATVNGVSTDYAYDTAGNIRSKTGHSYEYNNPQWLDQLTAYDGGDITYDECGNPLEYYNGSTFTWTQGRKLESANVSGTSVSYAYDMAGVRSGKTVGGTSYSFTTLSGLVTRQTWGDSAIDFVYDENNQPLAMRYNGTWYYYVLNLQGDVVKLIRADGAIVASYSYDPWGKVLTSSGSLADVNPLRYRGYYYDTETGFYYLQSRYYDPELGRFINADSYATTDAAGLLSTNMYAYCENDPVNRSDPTGEFWNIVLGAVVGGVVSALCAGVSGGSTEDIVKAFVVGAAEGAICSAVPALAPIIGVNSNKIAMVARTIVATYEAAKTAYECYQYGIGWKKSAFAGAAVFASSFMYGMTGDLLTDTVFDLTYGLGASLTAQMIAVETKESGKHSEGITFYSTNSGKRYVGPIERMQYNRNSYIIPTSPR